MYGEEIEHAVWDSDRLGPLYAELMPKGRPVAPEAVTVVAEVFRVIGRTDDPGSFLLFLLDLATHQGGEIMLPALRPHLGRIEDLSTSDDDFAARMAVDLLGRCGPDDELAARLRRRAATGGWIVPHLLVAVVRLQGAAALGWLGDFLAPQHAPAAQVGAVLAMRLAGSPALPGMDDVVVSAWEAEPYLDLPNDAGGRLEELAGYLGPQVLVRLGQSASPEARKDVARVLEEVVMPDRTLLRSLLDDPDEKVRQRAWRTLCCTERLTRQNTDILVKAINDGHPARFAAANALAGLGDLASASPLVPEAIRKGKAGKALLHALAEIEAPLDGAVRDAALSRVVELAKLIGKDGHGMRPATEFNALMRVIERRGGPECIPGLAEALQQADWFASIRLRRALGYLGEGDPRAIAALEASSDGSLLHLAENWAAGGDERALRQRLAATPPDDPLASRLREILANPLGDPGTSSR